MEDIQEWLHTLTDINEQPEHVNEQKTPSAPCPTKKRDSPIREWKILTRTPDMFTVGWRTKLEARARVLLQRNVCNVFSTGIAVSEALHHMDVLLEHIITLNSVYLWAISRSVSSRIPKDEKHRFARASEIICSLSYMTRTDRQHYEAKRSLVSSFVCALMNLMTFFRSYIGMILAVPVTELGVQQNIEALDNLEQCFMFADACSIASTQEPRPKSLRDEAHAKLEAFEKGRNEAFNSYSNEVVYKKVKKNKG